MNNLHKPFFFLFLLLSICFRSFTYGFGSMGPISAAFGDNGFFCAIDASGKQEVICWGKNSSSSSSSSTRTSSSSSMVFAIDVPPMAALNGGDGFMCGILANTSCAYCWNAMGSSSDLVPQVFKFTPYSYISSGKDHVCAIRGSYYSNSDSGFVDCWDIVEGSRTKFSSKQSVLFYDQEISSLSFENIVSGEGFSCGNLKTGGIKCWGPNASLLGVSNVSETFHTLASGKDSLCGVLESSGEIKCWGNGVHHPNGTSFVSLATGAQHFCGIRTNDHGIECWGNVNSSYIPKDSGFLAISSSDSIICAIREDDLVVDCWFANVSPSSFDPPLQLFSPGLCSPGLCARGKFAFNASLLHEPGLTSLCVRKDLKICSPCGFNCANGFFPSSTCSENADRVCTSCSLCQNTSCSTICKLKSPKEPHQDHRLHQLRGLIIIIGSSVLGFLLILIILCLSIRFFGKQNKKKFASCIGKPGQGEPDALPGASGSPSTVTVTPCPDLAQVFRLSELKDATNGFKEFNELGRGSYGFVYKAVLADGRHVAVKRANAATIIHTNTRDFEMELEILCGVRHKNVVNLLGYCAEMGERLLVYELMPHGTLHDHLHGGLSPLNWPIRLKISMQASKGLEFLHKFNPPIAHRDVKSSNILLDADWGARISDFGLLRNEGDVILDMRDDVYNFGIVLLELLSGRKANDRDCEPASIVEWALPLIRKGKSAAIIDRFVGLPRNVEPLLKLAEIAEAAVSENPCERPSMAELSVFLEQLVKEGLIF